MSYAVPGGAPLGCHFGCDVVSVAQSYNGNWLVTHCCPYAGPELVAWSTDYHDAVAKAHEIEARLYTPVLELPRSFSRMHVLATDDGYLVQHEGRSGENHAVLQSFNHDEYDEALAFAKSQLGQYAPCLMGEVCSCHF